MKTLNPIKIQIGDIILVNSRTATTRWVQKWLGFGSSSKWTHVGGSIGGYDMIEAALPRSRVCNIQKLYLDKGFEIKVLRPQYATDSDRIKVALWWATMNNTPYDLAQLFWYPLVALCGKRFLKKWNFFSVTSRLICSELIVVGLRKQGYNLFEKPDNEIVPADYDRIGLQEVDVFMEE